MENKYQVIALVGMSASGKDTVAKETVKRHPDIFNFVVSSTTRPPREGEEHGVNYYFYSLETFTSKLIKGEMIEAAEFNNWFYGTAIEALDPNKINICVLNPAGVESFIRDKRIDLEIVYVNCDDKTRLLRSLNRERNPDCAEICRRFFADREDFNGITFDSWVMDNYDGTRRECLDLLYPSNEFDWILKMQERVKNKDKSN